MASSVASDISFIGRRQPYQTVWRYGNVVWQNSLLVIVDGPAVSVGRNHCTFNVHWTRADERMYRLSDILVSVLSHRVTFITRPVGISTISTFHYRIKQNLSTSARQLQHVAHPEKHTRKLYTNTHTNTENTLSRKKCPLNMSKFLQKNNFI